MMDSSPRNPVTRLAAMRGRHVICLLVCGFALALAGCGSDEDGTIPPDDADNLLNQVEAVQSAVEEGNCELAEDHAAELITTVNNLPNDVDTEVASELTRAADNLRGMTADPDECASGTSGVGGVQPIDTTDTETTEEPETTTTTTTTEEETTTEEPPPEEEEPQPQEPAEPAPPAGGNQGGGQGGGTGGPTQSGGLEVPSGGGGG